MINGYRKSGLLALAVGLVVIGLLIGTQRESTEPATAVRAQDAELELRAGQVGLTEPAQTADDDCLDALNRELSKTAPKHFEALEKLLAMDSYGEVRSALDKMLEEVNDRGAENKVYVAHIDEALAASSDPRHLLFRGQNERDRDRRFDLLRSAMESDPNDVIVSYAVVAECVSLPRRQRDKCPTGQWLDNLLAIDSDNGVTWTLAATHRYLSGDHDGALTALRRASSAPSLRDYREVLTLSGERAAAAAGGIAFDRRVELAGLATIRGGFNVGGVLDMCLQRVGVDTAWAQACADYGQTIRASHLRKSTGVYDIEMIALEALGDNERLAEVTQERDKKWTRPRDLSFTKLITLARPRPATVAAKKLLQTDPRVWGESMRIKSFAGAEAANLYVMSEVVRIVVDNLDPECADQSALLSESLLENR